MEAFHEEYLQILLSFSVGILEKKTSSMEELLKEYQEEFSERIPE